MLSVLKERKSIILAVILISYLISKFHYKEKSPVVQLKTGAIQGFVSTSRNGRRYYEFLGIPYAKPPVGKLRFESPQPAENWEGTLSTTEYGAECKGFEFMVEGKLQGEESCLFLNVMTPKVHDNAGSGSLLPVVVYIHGGAFHMRSGKGFGGKFFMDEDVVLVTINYRLGIFGFLNTNDNVVKGNMGLKDQVQALKWVQTNIRTFGGDPDQVTIMGPSAGGASVHMLMLSPMGKGLFHRGISTGCEAISDMWQLSRNNSEHIELIGEHFGCPSTPTTKFVKCMKNLDADTLASIHSLLISTDLFHNFGSFGPSIEKPGPDTFLTEDPLVLLQEGRVENKVPWMAGVNENEGFVVLGKMLQIYTISEILSNKVWNELLQHMLFYNKTSRPEVASIVKRNFFGNKPAMEEPELMETLSALISEKVFFKPLAQSAKLQSAVAPVHVFFYSYKSFFCLFNFIKWSTPHSAIASKLAIAYHSVIELFNRYIAWWKPYHQYGAAHGDENFLIFNVADLPEFITNYYDLEMSRTLVKTVVDFANVKKPVQFQNLPWPSVQPSKPMPVMLLKSGKPEISYDAFDDRLKFWEELNLPRT